MIWGISLTKLLGGWIERLVRSIFEGPAGQLSRFFRHDYNVVDLVYKRAVERSAAIVEDSMPVAIGCRSKKALWAIASEHAESRLAWLEFGVFKGHSINYLATKCERIHGFDSFEGLAENWRGNSLVKGDFDLGGRLPKTRSNVSLYKGFFDKTLPEFLVKTDIGKIGLIHLDCDTYESTAFVLDHLSAHIDSSTVIIFDDFFGAPGFEAGQHKAFNEFMDKRGDLNASFIAYSRQTVAVTFDD